MIDTMERPEGRRAATRPRWVAAVSVATGLLVAVAAAEPPPRASAESPFLREVGHPSFLSPHASPIAIAGALVFVANTPADTVDVVRAATGRVIARVDVGIDPVGVAVRPDGREVWVANHLSDSVSVIDTDPASPTFLQVVATVQEFFGLKARTQTRFDEPVGIAFADNAKAYVALSTDNAIAVVDVATRRVIDRLAITAQDPRAIVVRDGRLYVVAFESNNQTQISGCSGPLDGDLCTFDAVEHVLTKNNTLSLGIDVDIVKNPRVPDRDLFVFDTATDRLVEVVDGVGTLLYGLAVDSRGRVFVAQTDARNDANGRAGTLGHGLAELENRAFLNRITRVDCGGGACAAPEFIDLEPLPPSQPAPGTALATPFAIRVSGDDSTLLVTAAGSDRLVTVDATGGEILGRVAVDAVPRGIALESTETGAPSRAWILNAVANTVSVVGLSNPRSPRVEKTIRLEDPTHPLVKRGRVVFHDADASSTGTFSCESCHPDGHTDQLLWILATPVCDREGCTQIPPRVTKPIRGLRDTAPYHWDGIPGDPFGGRNTANIDGSDPPNCSLGRPVGCTGDLVDRALATTMCGVEECAGPTLSAAERGALARFLLAVPYPPAQRRSFTNVLSKRAVTGFRKFHIDGVPDPAVPTGNICGSCHRMPFLVSTNTRRTGMDAPTWRGGYDRWLILPQGRRNVVDLLTRAQLDHGISEQSMWLSASEGPVEPRRQLWNMLTEGGTGFSGAFARQVTLGPADAESRLTRKLLEALEVSAREGSVVLEGEGVFLDGTAATSVALQFSGGVYVDRATPSRSFARRELVALAAEGRFVATFTGRAGAKTGFGFPQPGLWTGGAMQAQTGPVEFPGLAGGDTSLAFSGRHVRRGARVIVDGRRVPGSVRCRGGELPECEGERILVKLKRPPSKSGLHFLQVQNRDGLASNDFIFHTAAGADKAGAGRARTRLRARVVSDRLVKLRWRRAGDGEAGFEIARRREGEARFEPLATVGPETRRFRDEGLDSGTTYRYRIRTVGETGTSSWSNRAAVTMPAATG